MDITFLSCLYGSELKRKTVLRFANFLSCLYGSELNLKRELETLKFLSCLYGSERVMHEVPCFL